jgi:hypothetical protein
MTDHTAGPSSFACVYAGSIPEQQYSALVSTVHSIIQEQHAKKKQDRDGIKGTDRSHYQRTPAFVLSAVHTALGVLDDEEEEEEAAGRAAKKVADIAFTPPRGGFTDVGEHSGSQARSTAWALLQSVLKVRAVVVMLQDRPAEQYQPGIWAVWQFCLTLRISKACSTTCAATCCHNASNVV